MNLHRGEWPLQINGVNFVIKFDTNALCEFEGVMGESLKSMLQDEDKVSQVRFLRAALWAGLQWDPRFKKRFSLERAGELLQSADLKEVYDAVGNALALAMTGKTVDERQKELQTEAKVTKDEEASEPPVPFKGSTGTGTE